METMYCYRLDENGIRKYEIKSYETYTDGLRRQTYDIFASLGALTPYHHHVKFKNIDKFYSGFLFTFDLTDEQAKDIILRSTKEKYEKAKKEADRVRQLYEKANEYLQ